MLTDQQKPIIAEMLHELEQSIITKRRRQIESLESCT